MTTPLGDAQPDEILATATQTLRAFVERVSAQDHRAFLHRAALCATFPRWDVHHSGDDGWTAELRRVLTDSMRNAGITATLRAPTPDALARELAHHDHLLDVHLPAAWPADV
ncbi:hypothetical protein AB0F17_64950 [Nonomuraea sp. NPDC026600]|uniref:hypothetical protein n=1 Tax=Nonomuraea sp. NPDC026600 TaxID=3155363 RepID=UPI0033D0F3EE